jgi:hypothetical protein
MCQNIVSPNKNVTDLADRPIPSYASWPSACGCCSTHFVENVGGETAEHRSGRPRKVGHHDCDRPRRIRSAPMRSATSPQRPRCQMDKLTARKFHLVPLVTQRLFQFPSPPVGAAMAGRGPRQKPAPLAVASGYWGSAAVAQH